MQNLLHVPVMISLDQGNSGFILVCAIPTEFGQLYQYCILIHGKVIQCTLNALCSVCVWKISGIYLIKTNFSLNI